jgi:pyruvate/2-oxoacid:ferredoxin oxidoreductase alpha subunit
MTTTDSILKQNPPGTGIPARHTKKVMKGNIAAAEAVRLSRVSFVTAYPITPQTTIIEEIASMIARGDSMPHR